MTITLGNALLATTASPRGFYLGLVVIVLGVGLLKPNVSAIVAELYPEGGARLDSGFTVFYIGINIGAFLGPLVTGEAQVLYGPRAGFAAAAIFMAVGVLQFYLTRQHLGAAGAYNPASPARAIQWVRLCMGAGVAALLLAAVNFGWIPVNPVSLAQAITYVIVSMAVLYFLYYLLHRGSHHGGAQARRRAGGAVHRLRIVLLRVRAGRFVAEPVCGALHGTHGGMAPLRDSDGLVPVAECGVHLHVRARSLPGVGSPSPSAISIRRRRQSSPSASC